VTAPASTLFRTPEAAATPQRLHIAMIAPPYFDVPPTAYGGVESVVADLTDALVGRGHEVTLIGAGQHRTRAQRFLATYETGPADQLGEPLPEVVHAAKVARLLERLDVDVVHDHTLAGPLTAQQRLTPTVVTVHGPASGEPGDYYQALGDTVSFVAISDAQRVTGPSLPWTATVYNSIRAETFPFRADKDDFAFFLGRFSADKAPHLAIEAARAVGMPIVLAGKCTEPLERNYFAREIEPRLGPDVTIFGVADAAAKRDLLSRAACLLFPICWEEPFGLVVIEAMACGTPVVALRRGAVPELVVSGQTGIVVDTPSELPAAIRAARRLDPAVCRKHVEASFTTDVMAAGYETVYRQAIARASRRVTGSMKLMGNGFSAADQLRDSEVTDELMAITDEIRPVGT
jgi:glycosyltransferase involved in cell wall biosynthesis